MLTSCVITSGCSFAADTNQTTINGYIYTETQIQDATNRVNTFQQTNNRLPSYVTISGNKILINDFLPYMEQNSNTNNNINTNTNTNNNNNTNTNTNNNNNTNTNTNTSTTTTSGTSITDSQINTAATTVKNFYETNGRLPNYVTINNIQVTMPQFLQLLSFDLLNINSGVTNSIILKTVTEPSTPTESITNGNLYKSEYITIAGNIKTAIEANGSIPNYLDSSLGKIRYESLIYTFSKILIYQKTNSRLPNYVSISAWSTGSSTDNSSLQQYLVATNNAQSTSPTIISLANSITAGLTTDYDKAKAIFNWVRDNISYSFYGSTQKGALGTLSSKTANCCDHSHLVVALARAAGIPARYQYGNCYYNIGGFVGWYGHVWAQLYVNGKWNYADACDNSTPFGVINAWDLNTYTLHGTYATLPF